MFDNCWWKPFCVWHFSADMFADLHMQIILLLKEIQKPISSFPPQRSVWETDSRWQRRKSPKLEFETEVWGDYKFCTFLTFPTYCCLVIQNRIHWSWRNVQDFNCFCSSNTDHLVNKLILDQLLSGHSKIVHNFPNTVLNRQITLQSGLIDVACFKKCNWSKVIQNSAWDLSRREFTMICKDFMR